jgi:hypothetical protein
MFLLGGQEGERERERERERMWISYDSVVLCP